MIVENLDILQEIALGNNKEDLVLLREVHRPWGHVNHNNLNNHKDVNFVKEGYFDFISKKPPSTSLSQV